MKICLIKSHTLHKSGNSEITYDKVINNPKSIGVRKLDSGKSKINLEFLCR